VKPGMFDIAQLPVCTKHNETQLIPGQPWTVFIMGVEQYH